ncbi:MAG: hypothetical protein ACI4V2_05170 [Alloprevotella sp.]
MTIHVKSTTQGNRPLPLLPIIPVGLTKNTTLQGACMIIFKMLEEERHLPFFIDRKAYALLESVMSDDENTQLSLSHTILEALGYRLAYVCISQSEDAVSETRLAVLPADAEDDEEPKYIVCPFVEGVALALQVGVPFYVTMGDALQFVAGESEDGRVAVPIRNMPEELLKEAIRQAVAGDNFELASALRDELRRRAAIAKMAD